MRLKNQNVEIVVNESKAKRLLMQGWKEIEVKDKDKEGSESESEFKDLNVAEIKELLKEKEIEFDPKAKKDELIELLEGAK